MLLTLMDQDRKLDIVVRPEQRIGDVYSLLVENGFFPPACQERQLRVFSMRQKAYINPLLTFLQGGIGAGDVLRLRSGKTLQEANWLHEVGLI